MNRRILTSVAQLSLLAGIAAAYLGACSIAPRDGADVEQARTPATEVDNAADDADRSFGDTTVPAEQRPQPQAPSSAGANGVASVADAPLEEVAVTGGRRAGRSDRRSEEREAAQDRVLTARSGIATAPAAAEPVLSETDRSVSSSRIDERSRGPANAVPDAAFTSERALFARAEPGEEIWVISTSSAEAPDGQSGDDDSPGTGAMVATLVADEIEPGSEQTTVPLPLKHTDVHATLTGYVGTVDVTQQFENPFDRKIEAVYLFPLPEKAAVSEFVMTIGERRIRGILRERAQAEQIYRDARAQGYQASLLIQHRPNVFEQSVANIEPGKRIDVNIKYFHTLAYRDGWYSFVFPTVVGPRYNPPGYADPLLALPRNQFQPTPAPAVRYLRPNERSGHDISISVDLDAGVEIEAIDASHPVNQTRTGESSARIELANRATLPNRDFILNFKVAGDTLKSNLLTYVDPRSNQGYFTMMLYPPSELGELRRQPMEMVFVLDCSGSMAGEPMQQSKDAILQALARLEPSDTFQIIRFSNQASQFGPNPVPATAENLQQARRYVRQLSGTGGTQMIEGVKAALDFPHDPERLRYVTFLTDGYIGNESEIIGAVHDRIGASRIFSFGVGNSVNRYLLERMAGEGRGAVAYLGLEDSGKEVMDFFFDRISHPALIDVEIDWGNMQVSDVYPSRVPDLFVGRPVILTGKFVGERGEPAVEGRAGGRDLRFRLPGGAATVDDAFIANIWARLKIADLADRQTWANDPYDELGRTIKDVALEYGLMSDYTAFVAVDASERTAGDFGTTVYQAVPVPDGVRYDTTVSE